jgi:hypothetical protein
LGMPIITGKSYSDNDNRDENGSSASSADEEMVLRCSDFDIDINFESGLDAGKYLIDDASNLDVDHDDDILDTQWGCSSAQDMLIPTVDTNTEHESSSRGLQCSLQFGDEVPLPSFPV